VAWSGFKPSRGRASLAARQASGPWGMGVGAPEAQREPLGVLEKRIGMKHDVNFPKQVGIHFFYVLLLRSRESSTPRVSGLHDDGEPSIQGSCCLPRHLAEERNAVSRRERAWRQAQARNRREASELIVQGRADCRAQPCARHEAPLCRHWFCEDVFGRILGGPYDELAEALEKHPEARTYGKLQFDGKAGGYICSAHGRTLQAVRQTEPNGRKSVYRACTVAGCDAAGWSSGD